MASESFKIADTIVGNHHPCFLIAEIGQNHDGSLGQAHAYVSAVAKSGFDAVKFQTHIAHAESTLDEKFRIQFSKQDATRLDYWKRMEFTREQWLGLYHHAQDENIIFLSSPFSIEAVNMLEKIGVPAWKIGSGEYQSIELLEAILQTKKPILLSTGMSKWREIDRVVEHLEKNKADFALLQCTSMYPTPNHAMGINIIRELKDKYHCPSGLSDHSGKIFASLLALAKGADIIEVHATFDKRMFGPDIIASVTIDELSLIKTARDEFHSMLNYPVNKDEISDNLENMRQIFTKSIAPLFPLKKGMVITEDMITAKKPGTGISYAEKSKIIGKKLLKDVWPDHLLKLEDLE